MPPHIVRGSFVISRKGRDAGRMFIVTAIDGEYAALVDGMLRKIKNPKRKKLRHTEQTLLPEMNIDGLTDKAAALAVKERRLSTFNLCTELLKG